MIKEQFGQRLRQYRKAKGYSQETFAPVCGMHRTYIAGIESGKRNISIENIYRLAEALDISVSELFDFTRPIHQSFIITVNGENFFLDSSKELSHELKDEIERICKLAFSKGDSSLLKVMEGKTLEDLYEMSVYNIADLLIKAIEKNLGINVRFKPIELEVKINY